MVSSLLLIHLEIHVEGLFFEGLFGVWVGHRGYQVAVSQTRETYEEIAKIPLCEGRSNVAEGMCEEWMNLAISDLLSPSLLIEL